MAGSRSSSRRSIFIKEIRRQEGATVHPVVRSTPLSPLLQPRHRWLPSSAAIPAIGLDRIHTPQHHRRVHQVHIGQAGELQQGFLIKGLPYMTCTHIYPKMHHICGQAIQILRTEMVENVKILLTSYMETPRGAPKGPKSLVLAKMGKLAYPM